VLSAFDNCRRASMIRYRPPRSAHAEIDLRVPTQEIGSTCRGDGWDQAAQRSADHRWGRFEVDRQYRLLNQVFGLLLRLSRNARRFTFVICTQPVDQASERERGDAAASPFWLADQGLEFDFVGSS